MITNPDGTPVMDGAAFPSPHGWDVLPPGLRGLEGVESYGSSHNPSGEAWMVVVGSPAWDRWVAMQRVEKVPVTGAGAVRGDSGMKTWNIFEGAWAGNQTISASPGTVGSLTGEGDPATTLTVDPDGQVVPVGQPVNDSLLSRAWRWPGRVLGKVARPMMGNEPPQWWLMLLAALPWAFWGAVLWYAWKKVKR